ncbi:hypothetical protein [Luteipulveratus mongoliensis]|uniref:Uncharacterized protein n=1 Tax=Luteipulveratus mongoliensis TaxID=571913 RepID=A0A0K1JGD3_9MICO|nr:hypothetical protein [Luteipulveratus mongoliensis]AKU15756.1 hypothetical protein VV02_07660 [Luteipulveratus mongoliensis]
MTEQTLSRAQAEDKLKADLSAIRYGWRTMSHRKTTSRSFTGSGGHGARTSSRGSDEGLQAVIRDNHEENEDVSSLDAYVSDRAHVAFFLNSWSRVAMEDFSVTTVLPHGQDVDGMCRFLDRWARHLAAHDAITEILDELGDCARKVQRWQPRGAGKEWVWIGDCPVTIGHQGDKVVCGTPIRVYPGKAIICKGCGTDDTIDGWIVRIVGENHPVTAEQLVPLLKKKLGIVTTRVAIRQWVRRGIISATRDENGQPMTDDQGRALFDRFEVYGALARRERKGA